MAEIFKFAKPLTVGPLKSSQPVGAALAFLGLRNCLPMLHGAQGCTAFGKVFLVRHFREPIPLQTTAMDQIATVMNADDSVIEGLKTICEKSKPEVIGLPTTGLSETQGTDIERLVREFRIKYPQFADTVVIPVNSPDFSGCFESGFALAVEAIIDVMVPVSQHAGRRLRQVNVLTSSMLSPGDIEAIKEWIEAFGLRAVVVPDIGDSMDGHLTEKDYSALTIGGAPRCEIETMGESIATLAIGRSIAAAANLLEARTGVPTYRFDHLIGLDACDAFTQTLSDLSGLPVPAKLERQRSQLQDAMVDAHFMTGFARIALALDPDLLKGLSDFFHSMGAQVVTAVSPTRADVLASMPCAKVQIGDFEDLERSAAEQGARMLVASSHGSEVAKRLGIALLRAGFPQFDWVGGFARGWSGYRNARQALFDIANLFLGQHHDIPAYRSIYRSEPVSAPVRTEARAGVVSH
ncbi:nitrogenase iron-molybdenum cofactor biosynthesis protein NifN [Propionivibrio limicola]|uniref:nitrogenase iron-molybdenum cofactor biosynthesis protein NifN n=1 Tax=Propionivibrio limicola TaxID=167645 RepID=UPI00129114D7|nr:nitrogenase iron-molybdenum cofactor biosynthesis protein NifN [Propionivibrio limicola]